MVTITKISKRINFIKKCFIKDLIKGNYHDAQNAFIGEVGCGPNNSLYIVTYDCIALANNLSRTWSGPACSVKIIEFVNLEINIVISD